MPVSIVLLQPADWGAVVPFVVPLLERLEADTGGCETVASVIEDFFAGTRQIWAAFDTEDKDPLLAICGTKIVTYANGRRVCNLEYATGRDRKRWLHAIEVIKEFAVSQGCDKVIGTVRKGYLPFLKEYGFRQTHVTVELKLASVETTPVIPSKDNPDGRQE